MYFLYYYDHAVNILLILTMLFITSLFHSIQQSFMLRLRYFIVDTTYETLHGECLSPER